MTKPTVDQIGEMASNACFYVDSEGLFLRMNFCNMEENWFQCVNEDTGEEYQIEFDEVTFEQKEGFRKIVEMPFPDDDEENIVSQFNIPKKDQDNVMGAYWSMMRELESNADTGKSANRLLKHFVEGYYRLWNRITGDDKSPNWH